MARRSRVNGTSRLRDLDNAIGLDSNGDGEITWAELKAHHADIDAYALARLRIASSGETCPLTMSDHLVDSHTDGAYSVLKFTGTCPQPGPTLAIDYRLFRDVDPQHRGLLNFVESGESRSVVFSEESPSRVVGGTAVARFAQFVTYVHEGVWHIWLGFDHILFLLSLLLPAVLVRRDRTWQPGGTFRDSFVEVAKVVTAFTLAHSITPVARGARGSYRCRRAGSSPPLPCRSCWLH